jgi:hypothetical protein
MIHHDDVLTRVLLLPAAARMTLDRSIKSGQVNLSVWMLARPRIQFQKSFLVLFFKKEHSFFCLSRSKKFDTGMVFHMIRTPALEARPVQAALSIEHSASEWRMSLSAKSLFSISGNID